MDYGITVLTDTTERSPTFSLVPFENQTDIKKIPSLCYLALSGTQNSKEAWRYLLKRDPRPLKPNVLWLDYENWVNENRLYGFDFSEKVKKNRQALLPAAQHFSFSILKQQHHIEWRLVDLVYRLNIVGIPLFYQHALLKVLFNIHSTLVMGRLHRYQNNVMTWVKPSCNKLIDRVARYVGDLLENSGITHYSYEDIVYCCFEEMEKLKEDEAIVLKTYKRLLAEGGKLK